MIKRALDISKNPKNGNIVDKTRGIHELTNHNPQHVKCPDK